MTRRRLSGTQLEIFLAERLSPPGTYNPNLSRYVVFERELDVDALKAAIEQTLSEAGIANYEYEVDSTGAWQLGSHRRPCEVSIVDLRSAADSMARCLELIVEDTERIAPIRENEHIRQVLFLLGDSGASRRWIWYSRIHHILIDGYSYQMLMRRVAELYNAHRDRTAAPEADFLGHETLLEQEATYVTSGQCRLDETFWKEYLTEYLKRPDALRTKRTATAAQPLSIRLRMSRRDSSVPGQMPVDGITTALLAALHETSGVACHMIGMPFMRRGRPDLARLMRPMVTVLPLWVDLRGAHEPAALVSHVRYAIQHIRPHQFYGGERAIRGLGYTGRRNGLYLVSVNYRVYTQKPVVFRDADSVIHHVLVRPASGIDVIVRPHGEEIQVNVLSMYRVLYGVDIGTFVELIGAKIATMLGDEYQTIVDHMEQQR